MLLRKGETDASPACDLVGCLPEALFAPNEAGDGPPCGPAIRVLIVTLALLSLALGIGPPSEWLLGLAEDAAAALLA